MKVYRLLSLYRNLENFTITRTEYTHHRVLAFMDDSSILRYRCGVLFVGDKVFQNLCTNKLIGSTLSFYQHRSGAGGGI